MTAGVRLQEPLVIGGRSIYPVVTEASVNFGQGMAASVVPLALLIEEEGRFTVALLGIDSITALAEKLAETYINPL